MISRIFIACLFLGMYSTGSLLGCKWIVKDQDDINHQFHVYNNRALGFLDMMVSALLCIMFNMVLIYIDEDKLAFIVQILEEVAALFEEDHSSASWEENTVENFLNIVNKQAEELRSCSLFYTTQKVQRRTEMYFKRLSNEILKKNGYSAEAWETIRNITEDHLSQCAFLVNSLGNAH
uniref:Interferon epsilon n=1 Tax=Maylandia zebra TaxID=106582 RepID=A0A3P9BGE4_9CICH